MRKFVERDSKKRPADLPEGADSSNSRLHDCEKDYQQNPSKMMP